MGSDLSIVAIKKEKSSNRPIVLFMISASIKHFGRTAWITKININSETFVFIKNKIGRYTVKN